jgi:hypothetical protein
MPTWNFIQDILGNKTTHFNCVSKRFVYVNARTVPIEHGHESSGANNLAERTEGSVIVWFTMAAD